MQILTICRQEAATICPRPGLHTSYKHLDPLLTRCPCWPASTANQSDLVTLIFDLLTLKVATSMPILVFLGLSVLDLGPMYATDRRQTASSFNAPA